MTKFNFQVEIEIKEITFDSRNPDIHYVYCNKPKLLWEVFAQRCGWKRYFKNLGRSGITLWKDEWNQVVSIFPFLKSFTQRPDPN